MQAAALMGGNYEIKAFCITRFHGGSRSMAADGGRAFYWYWRGGIGGLTVTGDCLRDEHFLLSPAELCGRGAGWFDTFAVDHAIGSGDWRAIGWTYRKLWNRQDSWAWDS